MRACERMLVLTVPFNVPREQSGTDDPATASARRFTGASIERLVRPFIANMMTCFLVRRITINRPCQACYRSL